MVKSGSVMEVVGIRPHMLFSRVLIAQVLLARRKKGKREADPSVIIHDTAVDNNAMVESMFVHCDLFPKTRVNKNKRSLKPDTGPGPSLATTSLQGGSATILKTC